MKKTKNKSSVQEFSDTINILKWNPQQIIEWAKREIKEFEELIKFLEKHL